MSILKIEDIFGIEKINQEGKNMKRFLLRIRLFSLAAVYIIILISCEPPQSKETAAPEEQTVEETIPTEESYYKGVEYAVQGKFLEAKEEFEKVLKVDPFYESAEHSLKIIKDVIEQKIKRETVIYLFKGASYFNKHQFDQAIGDYTKAIEISPKYALAYVNRGGAYNDGKGQYDKAIRDYTKALDINPKYAEAYYSRGIAYVKKGQYDKAISDFIKALEINPKYAFAYNNRGVAYFNKRQFDQAIRDYAKAININPKYALAYYNRGNAYVKKGQYDKAISDYTKAIEINPKDADAYSNRGFTYFVNLGNKIKGFADLKTACELGVCENYNIVKQKSYYQ